MPAISSYRGNRPTNKHTHKQTGPITINCAAKLSMQYKKCTLWRCKATLTRKAKLLCMTSKYGQRGQPLYKESRKYHFMFSFDRTLRSVGVNFLWHRPHSGIIFDPHATTAYSAFLSHIFTSTPFYAFSHYVSGGGEFSRELYSTTPSTFRYSFDP